MGDTSLCPVMERLPLDALHTTGVLTPHTGYLFPHLTQEDPSSPLGI